MGPAISKLKKPTYFAVGGSMLVVAMMAVQKKLSFNKFLSTIQDSQKSVESTSSHAQKEIQVGYDSQHGILSLRTIIEIMEQAPTLISDAFVEYTLKSRKQRRLCMHYEPDNYINMVIEYHVRVESLLEEGQLRLLEKLKIPRKDFEQAVMKWVEMGRFKEYLMLQTLERQKLKEALEPKSKNAAEFVKEFLQFQLKYLLSKPQLVADALDVVSIQKNKDVVQMAALVVNSIIQDMAYEKYELEEEDALRQLQNQSSDLQMLCLQIGGQVDLLIQEFIPGVNVF